MAKKYTGPERREFLRLNYVRPVGFKICKKKTLSQLLHGYTVNISESGILCNVKERVTKNQVLWISFDRSVLDICEDLEKKALIYQNGIIGKVAWTKRKNNGIYNVGIKFLTRQEKNLTHIYPKVHFDKTKRKK